MIYKKIFPIAALLTFFTLLTCPIQARTFQQEHHLVEKIEILSGLPSDPAEKQFDSQIRMKLKTREGDFFSQAAFDADLKLLIQEYDRIEPILQQDGDKVKVILKVWPKPQIREIRWEGNAKLSTDQLQSELNVRQGTPLDRQQFNQAFHALKTHYVKQGYFEVHLHYEIIYSEDEKMVDIVIHVQEGRSGRIKRIDFAGFTREEESAVTEMMVTKEYNFFLSWLTGSGVYNDEMIQHDTFVILNYIQNQGFADAQVSIDVEEARQPHRVILKISLNRGAQYFLGKFSIKGSSLFSEEELLDSLCCEAGDPFSPEILHRCTQKITDRYGDLGYIDVLVNYDAKIAEAPHTYDVEISIDEGKPYYVGMIKVLGNSTTQTRVILHETLLIPGELFSLKKLQLTEARLLNVGFFKNVNVYAVKSESCALLPGNYRDVHIEVEEMNTGHLGASFGFSSSESMFGSIDLTERNFNAAGLRDVLSEGFRALRGGGEFFHMNLTLGNKAGNYGVSWTKPYFRDTPWSVGFDLERSFNEAISKDYDIHSTGLTLHATYGLNAFTRVRAHYRIKYSKIHIDEDDDDEDDEKNKEKDKEAEKRKKQASNDGLISALGVSWIYDSTNSPVYPTSGLKSKIEAEVAGLGGDWRFLSVGYRNSYYYDLGLAVFKLRGDAYFIQPIGSTGPHNIPLDERFFIGGEWEVRGYRPYRLGPKFGDDKDEPTGGISMQFFSAEICKQVFSRADAFAFFDTGSVSMDRWRIGPFFHSVGVGSRVKLLDGAPPVTIGIGFPLNRKSNSDVKKVFISMGGKF